jgi:peptidyl-dipeptidase A
VDGRRSEWYCAAMNLSRPAIAAALVLSCAETRAGQPAGSPPSAAASPSPASKAAQPADVSLEAARDFLSRVNKELYRLAIKQGTADWIKSTYLTDDTERAAAAANDEALAFQSAAIEEAGRYAKLPLDEDSRRQLLLLRLAGAGPSDPAHRLELTTLAARLEGMYGKGKWCGPDGKAKCRDLEELSELMRTSRDPAALLDAWTGWSTVAKPMRPLYARFVELLNEGARDIGFADEGALWRSGYDMPPEAFEQETDRLWTQVKPLYDDLHCYVRARLQRHYGKELVPDGQPIPAHLLGNMWAQEWNNVYGLVEPYQNQAKIDVTPAMVAQGWDWNRMVKTAEGFYTSLGLDPLPPTFWDRSMFVKPRDREVVCHASAWNVTVEDDLRIKMCIKVQEADLQTLHHELGHNYYEHSYYKLPVMLYHGGANDGFHEAIGDSLVLSMTPSYLKKLGLLDKLPREDKGLIDVQMKDALTSIAFLPFAKLVDQWRWDVFSGKTKASDYNKSWWALRTRYQGVAAPASRTEDDFDPGAKYHVAANVPYTRYFLARILQFQFHRAMCQTAGFKGPLHECSIYGSKDAGARLRAMLELGQSKPWQEALFAMTGSREMDASAILDYFAPLRRFLKEQNQGKRCGW